MDKLAGNAGKYSLENVPQIFGSPLEGLNICYLGSSVTYGALSQGVAFAEYIAKRNGTAFVKEAVSGTTLVTTGDSGDSYVERMKKLDKRAKFDLFMCQLSTNDATLNRPLGAVSDTGTETVCGAVNAIIGYVKDTWDCPVIFYTNPYYESAFYAAMVQAVKEIAAVKGAGVIDMYTDAVFNDISNEKRSLYMADKIHPTKAGYLEWLTPFMERYIRDYIKLR